MKKLSLVLALAIIVFRMQACDVLEPPYTTVVKPPVNDSSAVQKVLLEEFTGAKCGNCPVGTLEALRLNSLYAPRVISISVHVGSFATPNASGTKFRYDFRNATGTELDNTFGPAENVGMPNGAVNRLMINSARLLSPGAWEGVIDSLVRRKPAMTLKISNQYNDSTRALTSTVDVRYLSDGASTHKLTLYLTEDSIVTWQRDYSVSPEDVSNYVHRHALRGAINSTFGDVLDSTSIAAGKKFTKTYSITLNNDWNPNHCNVIAFVNDGSTYEVLQAEEAKVK